MKITCLHTGSKGNCYIVNQEDITYLLDCGIRIDKIITNVNLNNLDFAYVSHEHKDHSMNLEKLVKKGVQVIEGRDYQDFKEISLKGLKTSKLRLFAVPIYHGKCKNSALIVKTDNECLLYATDFSFCKYNLKKFKFTHLMVECNYDEDLMRKIAIKTEKHIRQMNTHLGFEGLKHFIEKCIDLSSVEEIILLHATNEDGLYDQDIIALKAQAEFKKKVGICKHNGGIDYYGG